MHAPVDLFNGGALRVGLRLREPGSIVGSVQSRLQISEGFFEFRDLLGSLRDLLGCLLTSPLQVADARPVRSQVLFDSLVLALDFLLRNL